MACECPPVSVGKEPQVLQGYDGKGYYVFNNTYHREEHAKKNPLLDKHPVRHYTQYENAYEWCNGDCFKTK